MPEPVNADLSTFDNVGRSDWLHQDLVIGIEMFTNRTSPFKSIFLASYILNIQMGWSCIFFGGGTAHTFTFTHTHTRSHTAPHITTHSHTQPRPYTHTHTHKIHTHAQTHTHKHTRTATATHMHTCAHTRAHTQTLAQTHIHTNTQTYAHTYIHSHHAWLTVLCLQAKRNQHRWCVAPVSTTHIVCHFFSAALPPPPGRSNIATHAHTYTRAQPHAHTLAQTHIHTHTNVRTHRQPPCMADCPCPPTGKKKPRANVCCGGRFCACMLFAIFAAHVPPELLC